MRRLLAIVIVTLLAAGCTGGEEDPAPTLAELQASIFAPRCGFAGCHAGATPQESLDLSSESASAASLLGVASVQSFNGSVLPRVNPGNAAGSYLYLKLSGTPGIQGVKMPSGGALTADEIASIEAWIDAGAN